jgi:hypothetical protein
LAFYHDTSDIDLFVSFVSLRILRFLSYWRNTIHWGLAVGYGDLTLLTVTCHVLSTGFRNEEGKICHHSANIKNWGEGLLYWATISTLFGGVCSAPWHFATLAEAQRSSGIKGF